MPPFAEMDRLSDPFAEHHFGVVEDVLIIGTGPTSAAYLLPEYIERFRERWPEIGIEIRTADGEQRLLWLRGDGVDLVVGSVDVAPRDVDFHPVRTSEFLLVTAADHAFAARALVAIEEAATYPFVGCRTQPKALRGSARREHVSASRCRTRSRGRGRRLGRDHQLPLGGVGIEFVPPRRYGAMTRRDTRLPLTQEGEGCPGTRCGGRRESARAWAAADSTALFRFMVRSSPLLPRWVGFPDLQAARCRFRLRARPLRATAIGAVVGVEQTRVGNPTWFFSVRNASARHALALDADSRPWTI